MAISRELFEEIKEKLGAHTSWAVWAPVGKTPKSNIGDLSLFTDECKLQKTLEKLNPNIILAGLNGSTGDHSLKTGSEPFANFHSAWSKATDFKIRFATVGTPLEGAFMTDVLKHHYETNSNVVEASLRINPKYEQNKVEEFFSEIRSVSSCPRIFAFGGTAFNLIQKYNTYGLRVFKLNHYAYRMNKERYRSNVLSILADAGMV